MTQCVWFAVLAQNGSLRPLSSHTREPLGEIHSLIYHEEIVMDFQQYLAETQKHFRDKLQAVQEEAIGGALAMLREDIQNPELSGPEVSPDTFMLRANQVGLALLQNGFFAVAERLYRSLVKETLKYRQETKNWRHAGALYANTAAACAVQGNLDQAVVEFLKAAQDDKETYKVAKSNSFAITGLLQEYFGKPIRHAALRIVHKVNPTLTVADVQSLCRLLDAREYAFLAYVHVAWVHEKTTQQFPNEFSQLQIFSALRSLSSLLEVELKTIAGNMQSTFSPTLRALYGNKGWWQAFNNKRIAIRATWRSNRPVDDQLEEAIAIIPTDDGSSFWKSLLIAYIVRNYTAHQMEVQCALVQSYSQEALAHILHVMTTASRHR